MYNGVYFECFISIDGTNHLFSQNFLNQKQVENYNMEL